MSRNLICQTTPESLPSKADLEQECALDVGLEETFPASDPVAITITPTKKKETLDSSSEVEN